MVNTGQPVLWGSAESSDLKINATESQTILLCTYESKYKNIGETIGYLGRF